MFHVMKASLAAALSCMFVAAGSGLAMGSVLSASTSVELEEADAPRITSVVKQELKYQFSQYSSFGTDPYRPGLVSLTLSLDGVPSSGAYVQCEDRNTTPGPTLPPGAQFQSGPNFSVQSLQTDTRLWCFATSTRPGLSPAEWSAPFEVLTREAAGVARLAMTPSVYSAIGRPRTTGTTSNYVYGPVCEWCHDDATESWRWQTASAWSPGKPTQLAGGLHLPLPLMFNRGLDAQIRSDSSGSPTIAIATALGWVDIITTKEVKAGPTGFEAQAYLTSNEFLLSSYLPDFPLSAGQPLGTLSLTQQMPVARPSAPMNLRASVKRLPSGKTMVTASWSPPRDDGGSPVTEYRYMTRIGKVTSPWKSLSGLKVSISTQSGKTVAITVVAVNAQGEGERAVTRVRT